MTAALNYISQITDRIFERQMARTARKISAGAHLLPRTRH
jgi:hypothetical protein